MFYIFCSQCLWIISAYEDFDNPLTISSIPRITLTIDHINMDCNKNFVFVYDGIPPFLIHETPSGVKSRILAAFCGKGVTAGGMMVEASSGYMTVYTSENWNHSEQVFTAVFEVCNQQS